MKTRQTLSLCMHKGLLIYIPNELLGFCSWMTLDTQQGACTMAGLGILARQPQGEGELQGNSGRPGFSTCWMNKLLVRLGTTGQKYHGNS